ncbi:hypothetical protein F2Q70_00021419 [Brassica cretica]|uniref:Bromodomain associated domain-containing protein n=2 Tax=Brassica cretica TaxID=69181 RepID=A0A3N6R516_BRACR|nr:hypothetical protein F2Q70_00021419 [Brassica cretica]KAF2557675.1 hypothetical protein F2Q68_00014966 [Brassica cretica]KAF3611676.1 hypothetical protein DY000_02047712 [Brassica cretica]
MKRRRKARVNSEAPDDQSAAEFSFSLTRVAVSQICLSVGYTSTDTSSTLNTLTLITTKFLQSIAELAASFSNSANRTEANLFDIVNGLQDTALSTSDCFPGGSTLHNTESHCLIKSAVLRNLSDFVASAFEIPFAKPLPRLETSGSHGGDSTRMARSPEMRSFPAWLPPFPDSSLYLEPYTKERSDHLWENSDSVIGRGTFVETSGVRSSGRLPLRRASVRFKMGRDCSNGGGSCKSDTRLERRRDDNDGEYGREFEAQKKIGEEYIYCADIDAGEWNM